MTEPHLEHSIFGHHDPHDHHDDDHDEHQDGRRGVPEPQRTRAGSRAGRRRPGRRRGARLVVILAAMAVLAVASFAAYGVLKPVVRDLTASKDYPGPGTGQVQVVVNEGDSGQTIALALAKADVVKTTKAFLQAAAKDKRSASIQPGTYTFRKQMKASDALAVLTNPDNRSQVPRVTIREGLWKDEVFAALSKATTVPVKDYRAAAKDPAALGLPAVAKGNLEGWLFPNTYEFPANASAVDQLKTMVGQATAELDKAGVPEADRERVLTVASIVEGEAGVADRGKVARVVVNRLADPHGPTIGKLDMDSTVNYALQKRGALTKAEFDSAKSNPYDTYSHAGLPPGPISSPGAKAIDAAAHPTPGPWFFFVTVNYDTGETLFATTFAEHNRNDAKRQAWCAANKPKCEGRG